VRALGLGPEVMAEPLAARSCILPPVVAGTQACRHGIPWGVGVLMPAQRSLAVGSTRSHCRIPP
jgi:hypothetical protein